MSRFVFHGACGLCKLIIPQEAVRRFGVTTVVAGYGSKWRLSEGLPVGGSAYGELTDLPDYTFLDGRPTPLSQGQLKRRQENINIAKKVVKYMGEIEFAKKRYAEIQQKPDTRVKLKAKSSEHISINRAHRRVKKEKNN